MPQEIRVVQCFKCSMYQVDIVKKAKFWHCKLCGTKQNIVREFFRGSGAECRQKAQQFNFEKNQNADQESAANILKLLDHEEVEFDDTIAHLDGCQPKTFVADLNTDYQSSSSALENVNNDIKEQTTSLQKVGGTCHASFVPKTKWKTFANFDESKDNISPNTKVSKWTDYL